MWVAGFVRQMRFCRSITNLNRSTHQPVVMHPERTESWISSAMDHQTHTEVALSSKVHFWLSIPKGIQCVEVAVEDPGQGYPSVTRISNACTIFKGGFIVYDMTINPSGMRGSKSTNPIVSSIIYSIVRSFFRSFVRSFIRKF